MGGCGDAVVHGVVVYACGFLFGAVVDVIEHCNGCVIGLVVMIVMMMAVRCMCLGT